MKTAFVVTALTLLAATAAQAGEALPATHIIHKLTADGVQLRSLEAEHGTIEARVEATDGSIVKVGIDPQTADLTDAYSQAKARPAKGTAPKVSAAEAIQAAAMSGYWDVRAVEFEKGVWEVDARNDQGEEREVRVDGVTAKVL